MELAPLEPQKRLTVCSDFAQKLGEGDVLCMYKVEQCDAKYKAERPTLMLLLLLLLLRLLDGAKHSYVEASQHRCVHACKGTSSSFVAFETNRFVLQHLQDGLQVRQGWCQTDNGLTLLGSHRV